jgi:hypothetical protein
MELAGLEPATSWVRSYRLSSGCLQGFYARPAWEARPRVMRNLRDFRGVPSRERARVMKFGILPPSRKRRRRRASNGMAHGPFGSTPAGKSPVGSTKIPPLGPLLEHLSQLAAAVGLADPGESSGGIYRSARSRREGLWTCVTVPDGRGRIADSTPATTTSSARFDHSVRNGLTVMSRRSEERLDRVGGGRRGVVSRRPPRQLARAHSVARVLEQRRERGAHPRCVGLLAVEHERDPGGGGSARDVELVFPWGRSKSGTPAQAARVTVPLPRARRRRRRAGAALRGV